MTSLRELDITWDAGLLLGLHLAQGWGVIDPLPPVRLANWRFEQDEVTVEGVVVEAEALTISYCTFLDCSISGLVPVIGEIAHRGAGE